MKASQTIPDPPVGFALVQTWEAHGWPPHALATPGTPVVSLACSGTSKIFMYFVWLFVFVMGFAVLVSNLGLE